MFQEQNKVVESITYFPIDPSATYLDAKTTITTPETKGEDEYQFFLKTFSKLDKPVYLRQDITFLFADGRLVGKLGKWQEQTDTIPIDNPFSLKNNHLLQAISFHHAEIHNDGQIFSAQEMSNDKLYVVHSELTSLQSFRTPSTDEEFGYKEVLDKKLADVISGSIQKAAVRNNLVLEHYHMIPLTELPNFKEKPLPGFAKQTTKEIVGKLWEGLYKNYFLSVKKSNGAIVSSLGSTIPVILLAKDRTHLYVAFNTTDDESVLLYQTINIAQ